MTTLTRRHPMLILVVVLCMMAVSGLFVGVLRHSWRSAGADADVVGLERQGVIYMHPLTTLVGRLVEAQSAAVRGEPVNAADLRKALDAVAKADHNVGAALQTQQRFTGLRAQVEEAMTRRGGPRDAYATYTDLVGLAIDLIQRVSDTSRLANDRDLDSFYIMDAALIRLPTAMVYAGRATDLVTLAGGRELDGEDAIRAAVARYGVADAAEQVSAGLNKSVDLTARAQLGANIAKQLDAFRAAVDAFAPPTMLAELANGMTAKALAAAAKQVFTTALPFSHRLLGELDGLLAAREDRLAADNRFVTTAAQGAVAAGAVLLLALVIAWLRSVWRSRRPVAAPAVAVGISPPKGALADPRDLLDQSGDLIAVGWPARGDGSDASRTRARERPDAQ